jgi:hypothetical protein
MATNRIFYACQAVGFGPDNGGASAALTGVQSVGVNSTFGLEQVFQLGQIEIYENIEGTPEVELTIERVFDSASNLYGLFAGANKSITQVATARKSVTLAVVDDSKSVHENTAGLIGVECTGVYMSNYSANFSVDGTSTDTITVVGNHQTWGAEALTLTKAEGTATVAKRQNLSLSAAGIAGATGKVQSATVSIDFGREDLLEFGSKTPYFRAASFPVECSAEVSYNAVAANLNHGGLNFSDGQTTDVQGSDSAIKITYNAGGGTGNIGISGRCTGMNYSGGDASGGNATVSYSYTGYNNFVYA